MIKKALVTWEKDKCEFWGPIHAFLIDATFSNDRKTLLVRLDEIESEDHQGLESRLRLQRRNWAMDERTLGIIGRTDAGCGSM